MALALISTLVSTSVLAQEGRGKKGKKDDADEGKRGASMDTGPDPAYSEKSDKGPYSPEAADEEEGGKKGKAGARAAGTRKPVPKGPRKRDKLLIFGEAIYGTGKAPIPGPANDPQDGLTRDADIITVLLGATLDVSPTLTLGLRAPWTMTSVEDENRVDKVTTTAFGSPELFLEYRLRLAHRTQLPILFGVGVPVAQGDPDPNGLDEVARRQGQVGLLADAAQGWRDSELYAPKRLPIVLGAGIRHEANALELHASTKLVFGLNLGSDLQPRPYAGGGRLEVNSLSLRDVTLAGLSYQFLDRPGLWAGLDTWLVYTPIEPIQYQSPATDQTDFQLVAEPRIGALFGKLRPSFGIVFPIGGRLADSGITGFRLHLEYAAL